jgi:putative GTP pyrophosphokinase
LKNNAISAHYRREYPRLERHAAALLEALGRRFRGDGRIVLIEARAKTPESFLTKAATRGPDGQPKYMAPLVDIQDQIGCRIVVRSPQLIGDVIVDLQLHYNSIESQKRPARIDPSTFGYDAWHLICFLPPRQRAGVQTQTFEVQISTPFQYAWTVMEHDLLYKPGTATPTYEQKRAVAAAAALAYAADQLFELAQPATTATGSAAPRSASTRPRGRGSRASALRRRAETKRRVSR